MQIRARNAHPSFSSRVVPAVVADESIQNWPIVFVIDDDPAVRKALGNILRSVGICAELLGSAREFARNKLPETPCCLLLDVRLPDLNGLEFQAELERAGINIPIVFMTGYGDVPMSVKAMKAGAVEFLTKPFRDQDLLDAVHAAIERNRQQREKNKSLAKVQANFELLTIREQQVIALVATGLMNKQIAGELEISEITVKVHRGNAMRKIGANL